MSKIFKIYTKNKDGVDVERTWFDSSNLKYTECLDFDNNLKTLRVVFNNGTQYEYKDVKVNDYLLFREDLSQGKALNKYIKANGYEYKKLDDANLSNIEDELNFRLDGGVFLTYDGNKFVMRNNEDVVVCEKELKLTKDAFDAICCVLNSVGKNVHTEAENFIDENNEEYTSTKEKLPF